MNNLINFSLTNITNITNITNFSLTNLFPDVVKNLFTGILVTVNNNNLLKSLFFVDGLICCISFFKEVLLLKFTEERGHLNPKFIFDYQKIIIKKYNEIYVLNTIDRFLFYITIYFLQSTVNLILNEFEIDINGVANLNLPILLIVIPYVQNNLIKSTIYNKYTKNKEIFIKYSISKLSIQFIQSLHKDISRISNYHIFVIYNVINFNFVMLIFKNMALVCLFYFLKSHSDYFYYYKAIKVSYFYNSGYNFTTMTLYEAIDLANLIIKEKRWSEFTKMEVINTFYILITNKYINEHSDFTVNCLINLYKFCSLWTIVSLLKLLFYLDNIYINSIILLLITPFSQNKIKKIITAVVFYNLLLFDINDIIITFLLISNDIFYLLLQEIYFFTKNMYSIKKVLKMNKNKEIEHEFEFI